MSRQKKLFTGFGRLALITVCLTIIGMLVAPALWRVVSKKDVSYTPITLQECAPLHQGVLLYADRIVVHKKIAFCHPVRELEHIPDHTMLKVGKNTLAPVTEDASIAIFNMPLHDVLKSRWHIVVRPLVAQK